MFWNNAEYDGYYYKEYEELNDKPHFSKPDHSAHIYYFGNSDGTNYWYVNN